MATEGSRKSSFEEGQLVDICWSTGEPSFVGKVIRLELRHGKWIVFVSQKGDESVYGIDADHCKRHVPKNQLVKNEARKARARHLKRGRASYKRARAT